jgi:hypothetical protein
MKKSIAISIITIVLALGCSKNEEIFTEEFKVVIPTLSLNDIGNTAIIDITLTGKNSLKGFTKDFYFSTEDLFFSMSKTIGGVGDFEPVYTDDEVTVLYDIYSSSKLSIWDRTANSDYTIRFQIDRYESVKINEYYYTGQIDFINGSSEFIAKNDGWIAAYYERSSNGPNQHLFPTGIRIYKVDGNSTEILSVIPGYSLEVKDIAFRNPLEGYLAAYSTLGSATDGLIFVTYDGGQTWEEVLSFLHEPTRILFIDNTTLLVECKDGYIQTEDNGENWSNFLSMDVQWTSIDTQGVAHSIEIVDGDDHSAICKLRVSKDKGLTWSNVNGKRFYGTKIHFFDKLHGIAWDYKVLQYTKDGGKTWELLVFGVTLESEN